MTDLTQQGAHEFLDSLGIEREKPCDSCGGSGFYTIGGDDGARIDCPPTIPLTLDERIEKVAETLPYGAYKLRAGYPDGPVIANRFRPALDHPPMDLPHPEDHIPVSTLQAHARNLARG
jgi:hypothetical protein